MKFVLLTLIAFTLFVMTLLSCQKVSDNSNKYQRSFLEKLNAFHSRYDSQINQNNWKQDPAKVRILRDADIAGAASWGWKWGGGILGLYGGVWTSFLSSVEACSWCPAIIKLNNNINNLGFEVTKSELNQLEESFHNPNTSSFNFFGSFHNNLMLEHAKANVDYINSSNQLTNDAISLLSMTAPFNSNDIQSLINEINGGISDWKVPLEKNAIQMLPNVLQSSAYSTTLKSTFNTILNFINTKNMNFDEVATYWITVENMINSDTNFTTYEKNALLIFMSIGKYSYAFWTYADDIN